MRLIPALLLAMAMTCAASANETGTLQPSTEIAKTPQAAEPQEPEGLRFDDFPAKGFLKQAAKKIRLNTDDRWVRENRTKILDALKRGAAFAGHYSVVFVGCGIACMTVHIVDMRNGEVFEFPESGQYSLDVYYSVESRLMTATWIDGLICVSQDFEWTGRGFVKRHEEREKLNDESPQCPL